MQAIQLELPLEYETDFELEIRYFRDQMKDLKQTMGNIQRGSFARITALEKKVKQQEEEIAKLHKAEWSYGQEGNICSLSRVE